MNKRDIRIISGYGPQENLPEAERAEFYISLDKEIERAFLSGKEVVVAMDFNAKLGKTWIPKDKHQICENGKLLEKIIIKHGLIVGNGHVKCNGVIKKKRITTLRTEESTIDHVLMSEDLAKNVTNILIDEEQKYALTRITQTKTGVVIKRSDHNVILTELSISWNNSYKKEKVEILNFKDKKCQETFEKETSKDNFLSSSFKSKGNLNKQTNVFLRRLNQVCHKVFKIIKVSNKKENEHEIIYNKWNVLRTKTDEKSKEECHTLENELATKYSNHYFDKVKREADKIDTEVGGFNSGSMWKFKKEMFPQARDPPTAMLDSEGVLQIDDTKIKEAAIDAYTHRMRNRQIKPNLEGLKSIKETLCEDRLKETKLNKSPDWDLNDLDIVLHHLKKDASRDPHGYANEIFKPGVAGKDLKISILILMNKIKEQQYIPEAMKLCNISSIWKRKGPKNNYESYRGIF